MRKRTIREYKKQFSIGCYQMETQNLKNRPKKGKLSFLSISMSQILRPWLTGYGHVYKRVKTYPETSPHYFITDYTNLILI